MEQNRNNSTPNRGELPLLRRSTSDDYQAIFEQRAKLLATPPKKKEQPDQSLAVLSFILMDANYAVPLERAEAITRIGNIYSIPGTPGHILGIIHRRGQSIALVSLRHYFFPEQKGIADADFAIVVTARRRLFAIQVEDILGVNHVPKAQLIDTPDNMVGNLASFVSAVTNDGLALLNLDKLVEADNFGTTRIGRGVR